MIEGHGDDIHRYGGTIKYNFSSNIVCGVDHSGLMRHLASCEAAVSSYPQPVPLSLELRLAADEGVSPGCVAVTNGATEAIYLIAAAMSGSVSAVVQPAFSEYADACRLFDHTVLDCGTPADVLPGADVVWVCNPCNPTGRVIDRHVLAGTIRHHRDKLFVIDHAYADYTLLPVMSAAEAVSCGNVLLLNSLTKRFSVPGLRIGYAVGASRVLDMLRRRRMPWSVNGPAIEAAYYLLDHRNEYAIDALWLHDEALRLSAELRGLGLEVEPTDCNFLLARLPRGTASQLKEWLVANYGILIRDASNFHGLTPRHFRVAVQTREADDLLIKAIGQWMNL